MGKHRFALEPACFFGFGEFCEALVERDKREFEVVVLVVFEEGLLGGVEVVCGLAEGELSGESIPVN